MVEDMEARTCQRDTRGFTLLELIVVLLILGVLAAIAVPTYNTVQGNSVARSVTQTAESVARAANAAALSNGSGGVATTSDLQTAVDEADLSGSYTWNPTTNELTLSSGSQSRAVTLTLTNGRWAVSTPSTPTETGGAGDPGTVTALAATSAAGSVTLTWTAPTSGGTLTGYWVEHQKAGTASWVRAATTTAAATSHTVTPLLNAVTYSFRVTPVYGTGLGTGATTSATPMFNVTENPTVGIGTYYAMAYGNSKFVALNSNTASGPGGLVSADGTTWTQISVPTRRNWAGGLVYGNGIFVAAANNTTAYATSTDGVNWTNRTLPALTNSVTYTNGQFWATAGPSPRTAVMNSVDGITWTLTSNALPTGRDWRLITYGAGKYVAVDFGGTAYATSTDGVTWTEVPTGLPVARNWNGLTYATGKFVLVGGGTPQNIHLTSPDGVTWTQQTSDLPGANNLMWDGTYFWATVRNPSASASIKSFYVSRDGVTFTAAGQATPGDYMATWSTGSVMATLPITATGTLPPVSYP